MFLLWALLTLLVVLAAVAIAMALVRRQEAALDAEQAPVLKVLADELAEIDRQVSAGAMTPEEAAPLKAETRRRILAEAAAGTRAPKALATGQARWMAFGFAAAITASAAALYGWMGRPDLATSSTPLVPSAEAQQEAGTDLASLTRKLEARLEQSPNDAEGWRLLGGSHFSLGNYPRAAEAYAKALSLRPDDAETLSAYGETQVQLADGSVTPASRESFRKALAIDPKDVRARYFLAAGLNQDGDTKGAIDAWLDLLEGAPADAPWAVELRQLVSQRAADAKIDISSRLAGLSPAPAAPGPAPGPTAEQMAAAQGMAPEDQQEMIRGMVDRLEARLISNPADLEGWQRLIRARLVLGEPEKAKAALAKAEAAFAAKPQELQAIRNFASENGVS